MQIFGDDLEDAVIDRIRGASVPFVRVPVQWPYIEAVDTSPPTYGWSGLDEAIAPLANAGLKPIPVVFGRPAWASTTDCGPIDKVPMTRYQAFVAALVERYDGDGHADAPGSPRIGHWEIENEPDFDPARAGGANDHGSCFGGPAAGEYGRLLRAAHLAARSADGSATIFFGGVAYDRLYNRAGYSPVGPFDYLFVQNVLTWLHVNHGNEPDWPFFDRATVHVYNDYRNNWDGGQPYGQELRAKLDHFRQNQLFKAGAYDLRSVPIAITEASLASLPGDAFTSRSEALQAVYPGQLLARALAERVPLVAWFIAEDRFTGACNSPYDWLAVGLMRSMPVYQAAQACGASNPIPTYHVAVDHEPKPAYDAFLTAQEQLGGAIFDTELGVGQTGSDRIEAYRVYKPGQGYRIVAFTDNGERIGRVGSPPITRDMAFDASILPGWTGRVRVTGHLGQVTWFEGTSIDLPIGQAPVYVETD